MNCLRALIGSSLLLSVFACGKGPTEPRLPTIEPPQGTEQRTEIRIELPAGAAEIPGTARLVAGVHATGLTGRRGVANLSPDIAQLIRLESISGQFLVLAVVPGGVADPVSMSAASTAAALVFMHPLLVTSTPAAARELLVAIRATSGFAALEAHVAARIREGQPALEMDDPILRTTVGAVVEQVLAAVTASGVAGAAEVLPPSTTNGLRWEVEGALSDSRTAYRLTNLRKRWVAAKVALSADGVNFSTTGVDNLTSLGGIGWPRHLLHGRGLLDAIFQIAPVAELHLPDAPETRLQVFGLGAAGWQDVDAVDAVFVAVPAALSIILDGVVPMMESVLGLKLGGVDKGALAVMPAVGVWVEDTFRCTLGNNDPSLWFELLLSSAEINARDVMLALGACAITESPPVLLALASRQGVSISATALANLVPTVRTIFAIGNLVSVTAFLASVATSDVVTTFRSRDLQVIPSGNAVVEGVVVDALTGLPIGGATIRLGRNAGDLLRTQITDTFGRYHFDALGAGTYRLEATAVGFKVNTAQNLRLISVGAGDVGRVDFALPPTGSTQQFAGLSGRVIAGNGTPIAGATLALSGGALTNGTFRTTQSASNGTYAFSGVVLRSASGVLIPSFTVTASAPGYQVAVLTMTLIENQTLPNRDFILMPSSGVSVFYTEGFETSTGWTATGFWHRSTLTGILNTAYPRYVRLAPGDASAALPAPVQGTHAVWYGQPSSGNFLGGQQLFDNDLSGGTSVSANSGTLTSPLIPLPATANGLTIAFRTWFEIESQNPNEAGYDIMRIQVVDGTTNAVLLERRLNPFIDPSLPNREAIPFTSGGFNLPPVWRRDVIDVTAFRGRTIRLRFTFDTVDHLYNGFRGWIVDDIQVTDEVSSGASLVAPSGGFVGSPRRGPAP